MEYRNLNIDNIVSRKKYIDYLLSRKETFASFYIRDEFIISENHPNEFKDYLSVIASNAFDSARKATNNKFNAISIAIIVVSSFFLAYLPIGIEITGFNPNFFILIGIYLAMLSFIIPASINISKNRVFNRLNLYKYIDFGNDNLFKNNACENRIFEDTVNDLIYMNERMGICGCKNNKFIRSENETLCWKTYQYYKKIIKISNAGKIEIKKEYDKNSRRITPSQSIVVSIISIVISLCLQIVTICGTWNDVQQNKSQFIICIILFPVLSFFLTSLITKIVVNNSIARLDSLICIQGRMNLEMPYSIEDKALIDNKIIIKGFKGKENDFEYFKTEIMKKIIKENKLNITSRDIYLSNGDIIIICTNVGFCDDSELLELFRSNSYEALIKKLYINTQ